MARRLASTRDLVSRSGVVGLVAKGLNKRKLYDHRGKRTGGGFLTLVNTMVKSLVRSDQCLPFFGAQLQPAWPHDPHGESVCGAGRGGLGHPSVTKRA